MLLPKKHLRFVAAVPALFVALLLFCVPRPALAVDKDTAELEHYTLTMDKVNRLNQAVTDMGTYAKAHPEVKGTLETDADKHEDLDAITHRISSVPAIVTILNKNGLPPREFVLVEMSLIQASMAFAMKPADQPDAKYAADVHMNPANLAFVREHQAELKAIQGKMSGSE